MKTEGKPSAGIKKVATWVSALKIRMDYRLSVIRYALTKYGRVDYIKVLNCEGSDLFRFTFALTATFHPCGFFEGFPSFVV